MRGDRERRGWCLDRREGSREEEEEVGGRREEKEEGMKEKDEI